ncbi:MAG TPA: FumA C-terminus/TtdB family hydratase beta subunit [Deltaproteobacteria bacterium]|nr:FumA C-terminus/TtdB family hydratase beta subunit [Deltaproteobacteria bacterium]
MAVKHLFSPLETSVIATLNAGDMVSLTGRIVTGRDRVHSYLASGGKPPVDLTGLVIYHCGPVVIKENDRWKIIAAGPTTSIREEPYEAQIIAGLHPGAIMGKGGMGEDTSKACVTYGCVYLQVTGGAAQYLAQRITRVEGVYLTEFGQPEAMWILNVENLPALVTMDSKGRSLHSLIREESLKQLQAAYAHPFMKEGHD